MNSFFNILQYRFIGLFNAIHDLMASRFSHIPNKDSFNYTV